MCLWWLSVCHNGAGPRQCSQAQGGLLYETKYFAVLMEVQTPEVTDVQCCLQDPAELSSCPGCAARHTQQFDDLAAVYGVSRTFVLNILHQRVSCVTMDVSVLPLVIHSRIARQCTHMPLLVQCECMLLLRNGHRDS